MDIFEQDLMVTEKSWAPGKPLQVWIGPELAAYKIWRDEIDDPDQPFSKTTPAPPDPSFELNDVVAALLVKRILQGPMGPTGMMGPAGSSG